MQHAGTLEGDHRWQQAGGPTEVRCLGQRCPVPSPGRAASCSPLAAAHSWLENGSHGKEAWVRPRLMPAAFAAHCSQGHPLVGEGLGGTGGYPQQVLPTHSRWQGGAQRPERQVRQNALFAL